MHFQDSCKLPFYLLQSTPSEDCLLIKKNSSLEIKKTVELKIIVLLVMKNIWSPVNPLSIKMSQVHKITFKKIVSVLFQCFLKALEQHFDNLLENNLVGKGYCLLGVSWLSFVIWMLHIKCHCVAMIFSAAYQHATLYYFRRIYAIWFLWHLFCRHDLFTFQKFCACADDAFLVSNESHDNRWRESKK